MPLIVHMPLRIRLDAEALDGRLPELEAAVQRATGHALRRSRRAVEAAGIAPSILSHRPTISWHGDALGSAGQAQRDAAERAVQVAIGRALSVLHETSPQPAAQHSAREKRDRNRRRGLGHYMVDSYEGGTTVLPVEEQGEPELAWNVHGGVPGQLIDLHERFEMEEVFAGLYHVEDPAALLALRDDNWYLTISLDGFTSWDKTAALRFSHPVGPHAVLDGTIIRWETQMMVPQATPASLRQLPLPGAPAERLAFLRDIFGPTMRAAARDQLSADTAMDAFMLDNATYDAQVESAVEAGIASMLTTIGDDRKFVLHIEFGDGTFFCIYASTDVQQQLGWSGSVRVMPFTSFVRRSAGRDKKAMRGLPAGGQPQDGSPGTPGDGSRYGIPGQGGVPGKGRIFPGLPPSLLGSLLGGITCEAFRGSEADPATLGGQGEQIRALVQEISERLEIAPCRYPATFCLIAADAIASRAEAVGRAANADFGGRLSNASDGARGNMGRVSFAPSASPGFLLLRRLAQAATRTSLLVRLVADAHLGPGGAQLEGRYQGRADLFAVHFSSEARDALTRSTSTIFISACQMVMLQLLSSSYEQIAARQRNLPAYAGLFQEIMLARLSNLGVLTKMRDRLADFEKARLVQRYIPAVDSWTGAARALADACVASEGFAHLPGAAHEIVETGGTARIRDEQGFLWTRQALETAIAQSRGDAESMDPLIQQFSDIPETIERFRADPTAAARILGDLLEDMRQRNLEQQVKARGDRLFGLQSARITRDATSSQVAGVPFALAGAHLLAHEMVGPFFGGDRIWADGIYDALSEEDAKDTARHILEFAVLTVLAVCCPPAAFVVGAVIAAAEVIHARSRLDLYRALINPELVLNRAELELELYIAYVGFALALIPEATTAVRTVSIGVRKGLRSGAGAGLRLAGKSLLRHASRQTTAALSRELLPALIREAATNLVMNKVIEAVTGPILERIGREIALHSAVGGQAGAAALIQAIEHDAGRRAEEPLPPGLAEEAH